MKVDKSQVKIGCDFEMFLMNSKGKVYSAIPFNEGTKDNPKPLDREGCCIQRDGVLQEANLPPVNLKQSDDFWDNLEYIKDYINEKFAKENNLRLVCCPTAELEDDQLLDEEARTFGCDPDYNAWDNGNMNEKNIPEGTKLRSCGSHIHMSIPNIGIDEMINLMKVFDVFLTVPFVLIDKDKKRRELYGKAGSFRPKIYGNTTGFEARTLSNVWISEQEYVDYVFHQLNSMFDYYNDNIGVLIDSNQDLIVNCINTSNEDQAKEICEKFNVLLPLEILEKNERIFETV